MSNRYSFATEAVARVAQMLRDTGFGSIEAQRKTSHQDLVTDMDKLVEATLRGEILAKYPGDIVIGEESSFATAGTAQTQTAGGGVWYLDPIDGTTNYASLYKNFSISLAYCEDGATQFGIVCDVMGGHMYHAIKGKGAYKDALLLATPQDMALADAVLSTPIVNDVFLSAHPLQAASTRLAADIRAVRSMGCVSLELCELAEGATGLFLTLRSCPWDHNAAALVVREAGGVFRPLYEAVGTADYSGPIFAAANEALARQVYTEYFGLEWKRNP